jgi:hypothetical protein
VVINDLKLSNVAVLLHHAKKLLDDLGRRADEHLTLSPLLGVRDSAKRILQN